MIPKNVKSTRIYGELLNTYGYQLEEGAPFADMH